MEHEDLNFGDAQAVARATQGPAEVLDSLGYCVFYQTSYASGLFFPARWYRPLNGDLIALP